MGDTFSAFVKFISDDPIMLGLCIAIIVLVILFIAVLVIGKKREDKERERENTAELLKTEVNLEALESTQQYSLDELQGLKEPKLEEPKEKIPISAIENKAPTEDKFEELIPQTINEEPAIEIPIEVNENVKPLEIQPETTKNEVVTENSPYDSVSKTFDSSAISSNSNGFPTAEEFSYPVEEVKIVESAIEPLENKEIKYVETEEKPITQTIETTEPVMESSVSPIEETDYNGADSLIEFTEKELEATDIENFTSNDEAISFDPINPFGFNIDRENIFDKEQNGLEELTTSEPLTIENVDSIEPSFEFPVFENKTSESDIKIEDATNIETLKSNIQNTEPEQSTVKENMEPFSSIYLNTETIELPEIKVDSFSKTAILRNLPTMESMPSIENIEDLMPNNESEEEIDLPKLSIDPENTSAINSIKGESFDIE